MFHGFDYLCLTLLAPIHCLCMNNFTFLQHSELLQYFDSMSTSSQQIESGRPMAYLHKREKITKCQQSLAAIRYRSHPSNETLPPPSNADTAKLFAQVKDLYNRDFLNGIQIIEVAVELLKRVIVLPALPCILEPDFAWFITPGFHFHEYFALRKFKMNENFHLHGVIESAAKVDMDISYDQFKIEIHFLKNLKSAVYKKKKRNFCRLSTLQRLRLCSSVHMIWRELSRREIFKENLSHDNTGHCIENAIVSFEKITNKNTGFEEDITVDLVGCAINMPWKEPEFYLAANQNVLNAAYVLQKHQIEGENVTYQLFIHLKDISALANETKIIRTLYEISS